MRPFRLFLFFLIFLACFTGLHYIIPASWLFPSIYDFIPEPILSGLSSGDGTAVKFDSSHTVHLQRVTFTDSVNSVVTAPADSQVISFYSLNGFLDSLRDSRSQHRIMYYGDSQIEGDRITSYLRHTLRKSYGGTGPGLFLPLMPVMYTNSIWIRSSSNWKRYNYLSYKAGRISHKNLGPFMTICRYLPEGEKAALPVKAYVRIKPSNIADTASSCYDLLRVFYGNTSDVVNISVKADDYEVFADTLSTVEGINEVTCRLNKPANISIEFSGRVSPDIYGISIESSKGIIVDNIPQRGSAGLEFTMVDSRNLAESYRLLSPDLFILHYGLNIVRNVREDYSYYRRGLLRQLLLLKEVSPGTPILVVSLTDMADNENDKIVSYNNIPSIIDAQRQATREANVAFWDSYSAMGGESSIIRWTEMKPALAQKDFVHFTSSGADTLSKILAETVFTERIEGIDNADINAFQYDTLCSDNILTASETGMDSEAGGTYKSLLLSIFNYNQKSPLIFPMPAFWIFFILVLAGYSMIYKKLFARNIYLFVVSLFFYYKSGGLLLILLLFVTLVDFTSGLLIAGSKKRILRRLYILLSLVSNLGILAYFKYTGLIVHTINDLLGTEFEVYDFIAAFSNSYLGTSLDISNIILPVGISFFIFQSLSYTIDVYRKKLEPVRNIIDFGFYVSFFPQLVAGPIVRASEFIPQLNNKYHLEKREFSHALFLISKGLIKKIVISDFIAVNFIDRVFDAPSVYSGFENLMAIYGYGLQIYCDFSGYTDIAIGIGLILGFRLPLNFNSPYKAASLNDFWKRWHISLSRWLKDYLYIPLGGNRKGKIRTNINLLLTMLLGGLWHGADLKFVMWGLLHGIGLVINKIWSSVFGSRIRSSYIGRALAVFITFQFVNFCWILFRAHDMNNVRIMIKQIFENFSPGSYLTVLPVYSNVFLLIAVGYIIHFIPERLKEAYRGLFIRIPLAAQFIVLMMVAILLFQMKTTEVLPFIYFRF